jgi:ubiquinone biosynthesis protein
LSIAATFRLAGAGFVLAREGALSVVDTKALPPVMKTGVAIGRAFEKGSVKKRGPVENLRHALYRLGPTYVKIGQTLATRPDIVGIDVAAHLALLQDKMEPFDAALVPGLLSEALGERAAELTEISPPIAAASIAQVHKAVLVEDGVRREVAVKILRPGIKQRFRADLEAQYAGAALAERFAKGLRRLRPTEVIRTLDRSARLELDLRLEAASISEMAGNIKEDEGFVIPTVSWDHTVETVLTTSWVEGIPIRDLEAIDAAGLDRKELARILLQSFLRHAVRDGFFHADMHQGNLFITRDYRMIAERHFEIGYVPRHQSVDDFALALRSIGEPLQGRDASAISMAKVLGQLFATTELFDMQTRPELVLLQKSMVLVEGVSRMLDPQLNIWTVAEPVVGDFVRREAGPLGRLEDLKDHAEVALETIGKLPGLVTRAEAALDDYDSEKRSPDRRRTRRMVSIAFWVLIVIAAALVVRLFI